jgi:hypothetical protein
VTAFWFVTLLGPLFLACALLALVVAVATACEPP